MKNSKISKDIYQKKTFILFKNEFTKYIRGQRLFYDLLSFEFKKIVYKKLTPLFQTSIITPFRPYIITFRGILYKHIFLRKHHKVWY